MSNLCNLLKRLVGRIVRYIKKHLVEMFMILGTIMIPLSVQFAIALPHDKGIAYIGLCAGTFCLIMAMVNVYSLVREEKQEKKDADKREAQRFTVIAKLLIDIRDGLKPKDNK